MFLCFLKCFLKAKRNQLKKNTVESLKLSWHSLVASPNRIYILDENIFERVNFFYWNWKSSHPRNYIPRKKKKTDNPWKLTATNSKWIHNIFICFIPFWVYIHICIWMHLSLNNIAISCNTSVVFDLFKWFIFFLFQITFFSKLSVEGYFNIWYTYKMRCTWVPSFFQMFCVMQKTRSLFSKQLFFVKKKNSWSRCFHTCVNFCCCFRCWYIHVVSIKVESISFFYFKKNSCYTLSRH